MVVLEGVNALGAAPDRLDVAVYLDATEEDLERWYVTRFVALVDAARDDPSSFYASMIHLGPGELERVARSTWTAINLVNLREHIAVTRAFAHLVVVKGPDHQIVEVREHAPVTGDAALVEQLDQVWSSIVGARRVADRGGVEAPDRGAGVERAGQPRAHHRDRGDAARPTRARSRRRRRPRRTSRTTSGGRNEVFVDSRRAWSGCGGRSPSSARSPVSGWRSSARTDEADVRRPRAGRRSGPAPCATCCPFRVFDSWVHEQDMRRAVARPGDLDTAVPRRSMLDRIAASMPFVVGKKAAAPDGSTVVFELDGPMARSIAIGVEGGRARLLDDAPSTPTMRISTDTETFARLACGRLDPTAELAAGRVRVDGDDELGRRVVEN